MRLLKVTGLIILMSVVMASRMIDVGDILSIHVMDDKKTDLVLGYVAPGSLIDGSDPHDMRVADNGYVYVNNIGEFAVSGLTVEEVNMLITNKLKPYFKKTDVSVLIKSIKLNSIYVLGEVQNPGLIEIPAHDTFKNRLMYALQKAGGITDRADQENVSILRDNRVLKTISLTQMVENLQSSENIELEDHDQVIVKQSMSRVYIMGQVNSPSGVTYIPNAGVLDYISEVGGYNDKADVFNIGIIRKDGDKYQVHRLSASFLDEKNLAGVKVKEGDIIYIPKHFFADWKDIGSLLGIARDSVYIYDTIIK